MLSNGAQNFGSGLYLNSSLIFEAGKETLVRQTAVYSDLWALAGSIIEEVEAIKEPFVQ